MQHGQNQHHDLPYGLALLTRQSTCDRRVLLGHCLPVAILHGKHAPVVKHPADVPQVPRPQAVQQAQRDIKPGAPNAGSDTSLLVSHIRFSRSTLDLRKQTMATHNRPGEDV